ncbi:MAG: PEGA domain-containing protein [Candidatus Sulfotelmatobacter sp.]
MRKSFALVLISVSTILAVVSAYAKDPPAQMMVWPESGTPILHFTFGKFKEISSMGSQRTYVTDTMVENVWTKPVSNANFSLYLYDKSKVRIAESLINVSNVAAGETIKFQTTVAASGPPASLSLVARYLPKELLPLAPPRMISITVNTVPQGAVATLDGVEVGTTPKVVQVAVGKHTLAFSKEGFDPGRYPFETGPDDASGGSISFELGASAHDTIELRDGTVLSGDLQSVSATQVLIRAGGKDLSYDRNQVKRITMVEREAIQQAPAAQPQPAQLHK